MKKNWWVFPSIFTLVLIIFYQSLNYYFFQDDWFVLNWVRSANFLSFFSFRTDIIYWRPLSMPIFFALAKLLFGLNPFGFHLVALIFHFINIVLVYQLFRQLKFKQSTSYFAAFIWGTAAFHFVPLSWISTTSYILGPTFIFSSIILFLKSKFKTSFLLFLIGLLTSELTLITIPLIVLTGGNIKKKVKNLLPFLIAAVPYLTARFIIFPLPATSDYAPILNTKIFVNLFWYFAWIFNVAERFSTIFYLSQIKNWWSLIKEFPNLLAGPIFLMISFVAILLVAKPKIKILGRAAAWFTIGLSPIILLANHAYAMYLSIASLGVIYLLATCIERLPRFRKGAIFILGSVWFISSLLTVNFLRSNHWTSNEQAVSMAYALFVKDQVQDPTPNSTFVFRNAQKEFQDKYRLTLLDSEDIVYQSLNGDSAVQVLYKDSSLKSVYLKNGQQFKLPHGANSYEIQPSVK